MENLLGKTKAEGHILFYDLNTCPRAITMQRIVDMMKSEGVCLYDSSISKNSRSPAVIDFGGESKDDYLKNVKFIDLKGRSFDEWKLENMK